MHKSQQSSRRQTEHRENNGSVGNTTSKGSQSYADAVWKPMIVRLVDQRAKTNDSLHNPSASLDLVITSKVEDRVWLQRCLVGKIRETKCIRNLNIHMAKSGTLGCIVYPMVNNLVLISAEDPGQSQMLELEGQTRYCVLALLYTFGAWIFQESCSSDDKSISQSCMAESEFKVKVEQGKSLNMEAGPKENKKPGTSSEMAEKVAGKGDNLEMATSVSSAKTNQKVSDSRCTRSTCYNNNNITVAGEIQNFLKIHVGLGSETGIVGEGEQQMGQKLETISSQEMAYSGKNVRLD
ncbi:hypothetical protein Ancab_019228 [Ancistrocladus abbreviatus]